VNFYTLISKQGITERRFLLIVLFSVMFIIGVIVIVNYTIDPLRTFSHSNALNNKQVDFDERQQKTNYLYFVNHDYESVMLGSSRTTYISQNLFKDEKVFNYAANGMSPYEYKRFLEYFVAITGHAPKKIYIGMDFFGTNVYENKNYKEKGIDREFLKETMRKGYRYRKLLNIKLFEYSIKNIRQNIKTKKPYYTRDNVKYITNDKISYERIKKGAKVFEKYAYDKHIIEYYKLLKEKYPTSEFVVYTTPVYIKRLQNIHEAGLDPYYFTWLRGMVDVFGEVHHFMYDNRFSEDETNYFDTAHFKPSRGYILVESIQGKQTNHYMTLLNKDNIEPFISKDPLIRLCD